MSYPFHYANDWVCSQTGFCHGGAGDWQVESSPNLPTVYHVETRLPNGKPALLHDMGQLETWLVMSGCGSKQQPPYERHSDPSSVAGNVH